MCGTLYTKPCVLVIGSEDDFPVFGKLKNMFSAMELLSLKPTQSFIPHYHAYSVVPTTDSIFITHSKLLTYLPHHVKRLSDTSRLSVIVLQHHLHIQL